MSAHPDYPQLEHILLQANACCRDVDSSRQEDLELRREELSLAQEEPALDLLEAEVSLPTGLSPSPAKEHGAADQEPAIEEPELL